jgi:molybdenum cofactor cytidylyltransferase
VADALRAEPERERAVELVVNEEWQLGMGSSIALGVQAIESASVDAVLLMLADQPAIPGEGLRHLLQAAEKHGASAACYAQIVGVPACLTRKYFSVLRALSPAAGAQRLLQAIPDLATVPLPEAASDVDTPADAEHFALR